MTAGKKFLKDLNEMLRERHEAQKEYWKELTAPARVAWKGRTWWLRWSKWKYALKQLLPSVSRFRKKLSRYREANRVWKEFERIASPSSYFHRMASRRYLPSVMVYFRIEEDLTDIQVPMDLLFKRGWEVKNTDDDPYSRRYRLEHEDYKTTPTVIAKLSSASSCEVIEHEREVTKTEKEYEIVCEGEAELTGRV